MQAFKHIRQDIGDISRSNANLDDDDGGAQNEPQEYGKTYDNQPSPNNKDEEEDEQNFIDERDSDQLLLAGGLTEERKQLEFLKKMGMSLEDARPSGKQIMKALKYFDLGVKIEVVLVSAIWLLLFVG